MGNLRLPRESNGLASQVWCRPLETRLECTTRPADLPGLFGTVPGSGRTTVPAQREATPGRRRSDSTSSPSFGRAGRSASGRWPRASAPPTPAKSGSGTLPGELFLVKGFQRIWGVGTIQVGKLQNGGDGPCPPETLVLLQTLSTRDPDELAEGFRRWELRFRQLGGGTGQVVTIDPGQEG